MNRTLILSTASLALLAAVLGFIAGRNWQPLDESAVILRAVEVYQAETGGDPTDCVAVPGTGDFWLTVHCGVHTYAADKQGRISALRPDAL